MSEKGGHVSLLTVILSAKGRSWATPFSATVLLIHGKLTSQGPPLGAGCLCPPPSIQLTWLAFSGLLIGIMIPTLRD